jgi:predicted nucleic acid-binding protein
VTKTRGVTLDTSVWVPYLRERRYAASVDALAAAGQIWLHDVVLLELYAGTQSVQDARDVDSIRQAAQSLRRLYHPSGEDFILAGRMLALLARRHGRIRPRDHSHDLLIAIGAARTGGVLLAENRAHMLRWASMLQRRARLPLRVGTPTP